MFSAPMRGKGVVLGAWSLAIAGIAAIVVPGAMRGTSATGDIPAELINQPSPIRFAVYGTPAPATTHPDKAVQGGTAVRVVIPGASADPWTIALADPIARPVRKGDRLVLAFYARVEDGPAVAHIANACVQRARAPYTIVIGAPVDIGGDWQLYNVATGSADADYAGGDLTVSLQLATARQTLDIGPIYVLDLGR